MFLKDVENLYRWMLSNRICAIIKTQPLILYCQGIAASHIKLIHTPVFSFIVGDCRPSDPEFSMTPAYRSKLLVFLYLQLLWAQDPHEFLVAGEWFLMGLQLKNPKS